MSLEIGLKIKSDEDLESVKLSVRKFTRVRLPLVPTIDTEACHKFMKLLISKNYSLYNVYILKIPSVQRTN